MLNIQIYLKKYENEEMTKSYKTAIARDKAPAPLRYLIEKNIINLENKNILDYGCGKGKAFETIKKIIILNNMTLIMLLIQMFLMKNMTILFAFMY